MSAIARAAGSTAAFTATATCSQRSTRWPPSPRPPASAPARRSPEPRCRPTCSPPTNAPPGSTPESSTSNVDSPTPSASAPGTLGLGAPADIDALHQQITRLEQQVIDLGLQLAERDEDLAAARATNREFMARINASHPTR